MGHEPMANLTVERWAGLLHTYRLLWIGASVTINPNTGLHSRILEGITGTGEPAGTLMQIIDPAADTSIPRRFLSSSRSMNPAFDPWGMRSISRFDTSCNSGRQGAGGYIRECWIWPAAPWTGRCGTA